MITSRIITGLAVIVLLLHLLLLPHTDDANYYGGAAEICMNNVVNDHGGDCNDFVWPEYIMPGQQKILSNRFYTECKIFPYFPVCIYADFLTDILTPPPNKTV
jgi:hypothetical protein